MNKISKWLKTFVFGEEEAESKTKGRIHIITPDGRVELTADFENKADFDRIKAFVNKEDSILFCGEGTE